MLLIPNSTANRAITFTNYRYLRCLLKTAWLMEVPVCWGSVSERLDIFGNFREPTAIPSKKEEVSVPEVGVSEDGV